jgi:peptidoglycan/xylan/chitin deacetylase (PgdA/CDA1 family)
MNRQDGYTGKGSLLDRVMRRVAYQWPVAMTDVHCPGGMITFTFDDFPKSAATNGAPILEERGLRGTYYTAWGLSGVDNHQGVHCDIGDVLALNAKGHEIACHTYGHIDCSHTPVEDIRRDLDRNAQALSTAGLKAPLTSFAYPFGEISVAAKRLTAQRFTNARGVREGLNIGRTDMTSLFAAPIETRRAEMLQTAETLIRRAVDENGWLIFYTHDICANPSDFGATPELLRQIVDAAVASKAKIVTMRDAAQIIAPAIREKAA